MNFYFTANSAGASKGENVVIVYNSNDPSSKSIAEFYADKRSIPNRNLIGLNTSTAETISIHEYVDSISNPLLNRLLEDGWIRGVKSPGLDQYGRERLSAGIVNLSFLVTIRGIPLRFKNDPSLLEAEALAKLPKNFQTNRGSVDGELALIAGPPNLSMTAFVQNPLFELESGEASHARRIVRVTRLDGPSEKAVTRIIERTIVAEQQGLKGRAYFDLVGPHAEGDEWLKTASEMARSAFFDVDIENSKRPMDERDRLDAPAIYMGWYRPYAYGPWISQRWTVPAGAIGYHLHSYSGLTVRSTSEAWLGPLVEKGFSITFGSVYEPYLQLTHRPEKLLQQLMKGKTYGEAVAFATPALSWMAVALGDPLYRPFARSLEAQLEDEAEGPFAGYLYLREANRVRLTKGDDQAKEYLKTSFMKEPSLALALALADSFDARGQGELALQALQVIRYIDRFAYDELVVASQIANFLAKKEQHDLALDVYRKLLGLEQIPKPLHISLLDQGSRVAGLAGDFELGARWSLESRTLKKPRVNK